MTRRTFDPPHARLVGAGSFAASLLAHVLMVGVGAYVFSTGFGSKPARADAPRPETPDVTVEVTSAESAGPPGRVEGEPSTEIPISDEPVLPGGGEPVARPDMDRAGKGGAPRVDSRALNLADRDDAITLSPEVASRLDRDQIQRLHTSKDRASDDDRRSTTHPMDLVFLATGAGRLAERRPSSASDPSRGALLSPPAAVVGGRVGGKANDPGEVESPRVPGALRDGIDRDAPGSGILAGVPGSDHRISASIKTGRPLVAMAAPSIPANRAGRARDTVDSEQEVAATVQSLVHASTAGGELGGGPGGEAGAGPTGSQGTSGSGSRAVPFGGGDGPFTGLSDADPRISAYRRSVVAKIFPLWRDAFPKSASLEGKQGRAIVSLVIYQDGRVGDVRVARASGVPEFDENVRLAVVRAAPFDPFPPSISGPSMRWSITFDMNNPVVR